MSLDLVHLIFSTLVAHKLRSFLTLLGIAVGIFSVILLTSIGEGLHKYILSEFSQFGTTLIAINPGKTTTMGVSMGVFGTEKPLTIDDVDALNKLPYTRAIVGIIQGNAEIEGNHRSRRSMVYGTGSQMPEAFNMPVLSGRFLPDDDPHSPRAFAVLGHKVKTALFGQQNPIGQRIRIGGERYRVIGVMAAKGQFLGIDLDDSVYIPLARGLSLFNRDSLVEIDLQYHEGYDEQRVAKAIRKLLIARHGREDFTITTQQQMLDVMGSVLNIITFAVGAIAAISLFVGSIGIVTIMTIAVAERTGEIGLLRALGATRNQILGIFLSEATILSALGGIGGLALGLGIEAILRWLVPGLPFHTPWIYVVAALAVAVIIGLIAGVAPALHAARMDPVTALRSE